MIFRATGTFCPIYTEIKKGYGGFSGLGLNAHGCKSNSVFHLNTWYSSEFFYMMRYHGHGSCNPWDIIKISYGPTGVPCREKKVWIRPVQWRKDDEDGNDTIHCDF